MALDWQGKLAGRARDLKPSAIREVSQYAREPGVISFASGSPNPTLFPVEALKQAFDRIFADSSKWEQALQYGATDGFPPLRQLVAERLGCAVDRVLMTNGSQQGLSLVAALLLEPGDRLIVTEPTYLGALQAFSVFQPRFVGVPMRGEGLDRPALERAFAEGAKFMYAMPDFGNPTGTVLPEEDRAFLLALSRRHGIPVLEDQAYDQLRLSGTPERTLLSAAPDCVIHAGTLSKSLAPGLRVGWLSAPPEIVGPLTRLKQATDLNVATLNQMLVFEVLRQQPAEAGEALREGYRAQRDAMLSGLERHMPPGTKWTRPDGGMFVWLTLPAGMDAKKLLPIAMKEEKVLFVPGTPFFTDGSGADTLRLSYSLVPPDKIEAGLERLGRAVRRCLLANHPGEAAAG